MKKQDVVEENCKNQPRVSTGSLLQIEINGEKVTK
jgi:hypothetical protein